MNHKAPAYSLLCLLSCPGPSSFRIKERIPNFRYNVLFMWKVTEELAQGR